MLPGGVVWLVNFSSDMGDVVRKSEVVRFIWIYERRDETIRVVMLENHSSGRLSFRVALATVALLPKAFTDNV